MGCHAIAWRPAGVRENRAGGLLPWEALPREAFHSPPTSLSSLALARGRGGCGWGRGRGRGRVIARAAPRWGVATTLTLRRW